MRATASLCALATAAAGAASPLVPAAWTPLRVGSVLPKGWLKAELELQADGWVSIGPLAYYPEHMHCGGERVTKAGQLHANSRRPSIASPRSMCRAKDGHRLIGCVALVARFHDCF